MMITGATLPPPIHTVYDVETFPNFWSCCVIPLAKDDPTNWTYEISARRNDAPLLVYALGSGYWSRMYGFKSLSFDSPIVHKLVELVGQGITNALELCKRLKDFATRIIEDEKRGDKWSHRVHWKQEIVQQVDMYLIHHFDNFARATSLKTLEFNMRSRRVQDLPFHHETELEPWQMHVVRDYNLNDSRETRRFVWESMPMIEFREKLGNKHLNDNDTKIGKSFFISALERKTPGICYTKDRKPRQTWRSTVPLADCIFPWVKFESASATAVLDRLKSTTLSADEIKVASDMGNNKVETKGVFKDLHAVIDGFRFDFGTGGLHGSVKNRIVKSSAIVEIADIDVEAFYPSIAIENKVYPEHLGPGFIDVYKELKADRVAAKKAKDLVKSDALKLANNGVYGDSNNIYGPFYDPKYTMTITVNGQLMLVMAAEQFMKIPGLEILQANTDGMTFRFPRSQRARFDAVAEWWQRMTQMKLEEKQYQRMWIRDVNSYIGHFSEDGINGGDRGKYKRKGAYDYELKVGAQKAWHKDHSSLIVQRAANAAFCDDLDPTDFITKHDDMWDFLIREKVTGQSRLVLADGTRCQQTTRYYVAHDGQKMFKIMPPLATKVEKGERRFEIHADGHAHAYGARNSFKCSICGDHGPVFKFKYDFDAHNSQHHTWKVRECNVFDGGPLPGLNYDYYIKETEKLLFS